MTINWNLYESRLKINGDTMKDRQINYMQNAIINNFNDSPSHRSAYFNGLTSVKNIQVIDNSDSDKYNIKTILSEPSETFNVGDVVVFDGLTFLVTTIDKGNPIQTKGTIQLCNNTLSFYSTTDSTTHTIPTLHTIPCIIGKGSIKQDENKYITLPADENIVVCANTVDSLKITENTRFILFGDAYSVIGINKIENPGLLTIRIKEDLVIEDDNVVSGIANFYSNQSVKEIHILNGTYASLFYAESTLQLNIQCKENGTIITNPTVTYSSANATIATVNSTGLITLHGTGDVVITATYGNVSDTITIHGDIAEVDNYNIMITPFDDTLKLSRSMVLTGQVMNKGVVDTTRHVSWSISNLDGSSGNYATITPNVDTCTILAGNLSSIANKYIVIRASLIGDSTVYLDKQIKIINLF